MKDYLRMGPQETEWGLHAGSLPGRPRESTPAGEREGQAWERAEQCVCSKGPSPSQGVPELGRPQSHPKVRWEGQALIPSIVQWMHSGFSWERVWPWVTCFSQVKGISRRAAQPGSASHQRSHNRDIDSLSPNRVSRQHHPLATTELGSFRPRTAPLTFQEKLLHAHFRYIQGLPVVHPLLNYNG